MASDAERLECRFVVRVEQPLRDDMVNVGVSLLASDDPAAVAALEVIAEQDSLANSLPVLAAVAPLVGAGASLPHAGTLRLEELHATRHQVTVRVAAAL